MSRATQSRMFKQAISMASMSMAMLIQIHSPNQAEAKDVTLQFFERAVVVRGPTADSIPQIRIEDRVYPLVSGGFADVQLRQIVVNLIVRDRKYSEPGPVTGFLVEEKSRVVFRAISLDIPIRTPFPR